MGQVEGSSQRVQEREKKGRGARLGKIGDGKEEVHQTDPEEEEGALGQVCGGTGDRGTVEGSESC